MRSLSALGCALECTLVQVKRFMPDVIMLESSFGLRSDAMRIVSEHMQVVHHHAHTA